MVLNVFKTWSANKIDNIYIYYFHAMILRFLIVLCFSPSRYEYRLTFSKQLSVYWPMILTMELRKTSQYLIYDNNLITL